MLGRIKRSITFDNLAESIETGRVILNSNIDSDGERRLWSFNLSDVIGHDG